MHEIVIVKAVHYEAGSEVYVERTLERFESLWWFAREGINLAKNIAVKRNPRGVGAMLHEAIRFEFDFVPNVAVEHFAGSNLAGEYHCEGNKLFAEFVPPLVEMVKRHRSQARWWNGIDDFYVLFEVEVDKSYDEDGGVDSVQVYPTLVGELDFDKLNLAVVVTEGQKVS